VISPPILKRPERPIERGGGELFRILCPESPLRRNRGLQPLKRTRIDDEIVPSQVAAMDQACQSPQKGLSCHFFHAFLRISQTRIQGRQTSVYRTLNQVALMSFIASSDFSVILPSSLSALIGSKASNPSLISSLTELT